MAEAHKEKEKEKDAKQVITRIGKQLSASKTCPNKDTLIKLLKQATGAFPELKQSESLQLTVKPLSESLVRHGLLHHKDKDVRLLVGICVCEVIRVLAPNPGFSDTVLRDIFRLLLSMFGELGDVASPYFSRRAKLLETVAKVQFCLVMLDIGCEDLVLKMFRSFFSVVRDKHSLSLIDSMSFIITCILEENVKEVDSDPLCPDNASQSLLDVILQNIIKEKKDGASASFQLAVSVIQSCGKNLESCICKFLKSCISNRDAVGSAVKEYYHTIILEIFRIAPRMLLTVIPNLTFELLTDQVDVRIKALNLIKKLLALPGQNFAREYRHVFSEFLNRFSDKSAEVRITALSCAKAFYMTNQSEKESLEVLSAIQGRLLDHDDKVRTEAVNVVCELAKTNLKLASSDLISLAVERLRDKKVLVRSKALKKLVELYQEYCIRYAARLTLLNEHIEEIPCKFLMLCYEKDCKEFRPQSMELVLADLFPASLSTEEKTRHWIFMSSLFKRPHLKALKIILSQKQRIRDGLHYYLDLRNRIEENGSGEAERKMEALVMRMSSSFPDPVKAKDCFHKLYKIKDSGLFSVLQQFLDKETAVGSETIKGFYLRELGDQNAVSEFFHLLFSKCSFNIFSPKHIHYILDCLSGNGAENNHLKNYVVKLLFTIIGAFPSLLRGSEKPFRHLVLEKVIPFDDQLIEILAQEGRHMSIKLSDVYTSLETICLEGTRVQAKLAVSAVAALADTSEQHILAKLCKVLVDSLCNRQDAPTVLQSLGCLAQHSVSTFEAREAVIRRYIIEEIFQQNHAPFSKDLDFFDETSKCSSSCKLKVFGLKALVRSFLPHKQDSFCRPISFLWDIILQMLQNGGMFRNIACEHEKACMRLAAAKSVLRLSRKWDLHIPPQIFHLTVLVSKVSRPRDDKCKDNSIREYWCRIAQLHPMLINSLQSTLLKKQTFLKMDQSPWVRKSFATKLHKYLKNHAVPTRYACAFSFGALDSLKDLRNDAFNYLEEFIYGFGKGAQTHETMAVEGGANHPVNIVVFLIHVLAHDTNFPSPDCHEEKVYAQFLSPLFVTLEVLVSEKLGTSKTCNASSYLRSILKAIKRTEDAVDAQMTTKLHLLAKVGISILSSLNSNDTPVVHTPGLILLPSSLYKTGSAELSRANIYPFIGRNADASFMKKLVSSLKTEVSWTGSSSTNSSKQFYENPFRASGAIPSGSNPKSSSTDEMLIHTATEQFDELHTGQKREKGGISHQEVNIRERLNHIATSDNGSAGLHNDYSADNERERDAHIHSEAKLSSSFGSMTTKSLLPQDKVTVNSSRVIDTVSRCSSIYAEPSKSSRTSDQANGCSSKGLDDLRSLYCDDSSGSSANGQRKIYDFFEFDSKQEKAPKNRELRLRKAPQAVDRNKRSIDAIDTSISEVTDVNDDAIARRTRRRKV